jgi:hypothetical protein
MLLRTNHHRASDGVGLKLSVEEEFQPCCGPVLRLDMLVLTV